MLKRLVIYSLPEETDPDEFWKYHTEIHSEDFKKIAGSKLKRYVMNRITEQVGGNHKIFAVIETYWESKEAMNKAYEEAKVAKLPNGMTVFEDFMSRINLHFAGSVEVTEINL